MKTYWFLFLIIFFSLACKRKNITNSNNTTKTTPFTSKADNKNIVDNKDLEKIDLDTKIGQLIMVGINDRKSLPSNDTLRKELSSGKIGGVILFEKNIAKSNSKETLGKLITDLKSEAAISLFIGIDEEGGKVHRLKEKYGFVSMPSADYLGSLVNTDSTYYYAKRLANELYELGFNLNFAPDIDVKLNPDNEIISKVGRSYSSDPEVVTSNSMAFIKAHHSENVKTTLKHFPGHGSSASDTHKGIVDVTKQWQFKELIPYKKIIESGECDAIVSCHVINCHLDTTCVPSTLSKIITTELLRDLLGFNGVVFSDDMQMYAISKNYGLEQSIKMAINAGMDVFFGNNVNASDRISATEIHSIIKRLVENGDISISRINEAFLRVMELKKKRY